MLLENLGHKIDEHIHFTFFLGIQLSDRLCLAAEIGMWPLGYYLSDCTSPVVSIWL